MVGYEIYKMYLEELPDSSKVSSFTHLIYFPLIFKVSQIIHSFHSSLEIEHFLKLLHFSRSFVESFSFYSENSRLCHFVTHFCYDFHGGFSNSLNFQSKSHPLDSLGLNRVAPLRAEQRGRGGFLPNPNWMLNLFCLRAVFLLVLFDVLKSTTGEFEIDTKRGKVECVQCVQLWRSASSQKESRSCGPHASTCRGNACFMKQFKHTPVYQFASGCIHLEDWQLNQLEINRRYLETRMTRFGAILLCEDTFNQTTCICNRRDRCNSIHTRAPYTTMAEGLYQGVIDFDGIIGEIDPRLVI
ncbi:hypothetical protein WR25_25448 isoform B [Diploscapter pachys]|uniref:Uncharacterized protein n=1 Tax=Diploscapter pachys TaxID=2018661 RepID=A0A2A2JNP0_9BILA|nr:hypothetical protein WR25_25448 isoform B [Diploscapter pachys]